MPSSGTNIAAVYSPSHRFDLAHYDSAAQDNNYYFLEFFSGAAAGVAGTVTFNLSAFQSLATVIRPRFVVAYVLNGAFAYTPVDEREYSTVILDDGDTWGTVDTITVPAGWRQIQVLDDAQVISGDSGSGGGDVDLEEWSAYFGILGTLPDPDPDPDPEPVGSEGDDYKLITVNDARNNTVINIGARFSRR